MNLFTIVSRKTKSTNHYIGFTEFLFWGGTSPKLMPIGTYHYYYYFARHLMNGNCVDESDIKAVARQFGR